MNKKDVIMLFLDLEGTIIGEEDGSIKTEDINSLLDSINRLEQITGLSVVLYIASPVSISKMEEVVDSLDKLIVKYNIANKTNIKEIESAVAYPDTNYHSQHDLYDKIFPMDIPRDDFGGSGKARFVNNWLNYMGKDLEMVIYAGNGLNDVGAMRQIRNSKKGFVICPNNSDEKVKKIAHFVSDKNEAKGVKDGIDFISREIKKRKVYQKDKNHEDNDER